MDWGQLAIDILKFVLKLLGAGCGGSCAIPHLLPWPLSEVYMVPIRLLMQFLG